MAFDYSKLRGRIVEKYGTLGNFAEAFGRSTVSVSEKMNNKCDWSQADIIKVREMLDIPKAEIAEYFFTTKVKEA